MNVVGPRKHQWTLGSQTEDGREGRREQRKMRQRKGERLGRNTQWNNHSGCEASGGTSAMGKWVKVAHEEKAP